MTSVSPPETTTPRAVTLPQLARGLPALARDLPSVLRGLALLETARGGQRISIGRTFENLVEKQPDRPFLRFHGTDISYGEANALVNRMAQVLRNRGVTRGDTVGICLTNRPETVLCMLATVKLGAAAGLLNHHQRGEVLDHSQRILESKVVLVGAECAEAVASLDRSDWQGQLMVVDSPSDLHHSGYTAGQIPESLADLPVIQQEVAALGSDPYYAVNPPEAAATQGWETAYLVFTSGTTGLPKASAMSHHRWIKAMAGFGLSGARLRRTDVLFCPLPLYHNNAVTVGLGCVLAAGACLAIEEHFSTSRYWAQVRENQSTVAIYIGEFFRYLLSAEPYPLERQHNLRMIVGNGLRPEIWNQVRSRFGIQRMCEFYAASECNIAFVNAFNVDRTTGFCPMSFKLVEFDEDTGEPRRAADGRLRTVSRGQPGLLITGITASQPFDGYTDPEATEKKIVRNAFKDGDAWFISGDLMLNQGFNHAAFVDRMGDTFRWKGENVATTEVEGALLERDEIAQAAVYGVKLPNSDGRAGMAAISLRPGAEFDGYAVAEHVRRMLPSYAAPLYIRLVAEVEVTSTFKSRKAELRRQGYDQSTFDDPLYVLNGDEGYVPAYDGAERDLVGRMS